MIQRSLAALLAVATPLPALAQPAQPPCITTAEAEQFFLAVAPDLIIAAGTACAVTLPPAALLRRTDGPFLADYRAAAEGAWPKAMAAVAKIAGPNAQALLSQSDLIRPMIGGLMAAELVGKMKPADCVRADRMLTLLSPLPPQNLAAVAIAVVEATQAKRAKPTDKLRICPAA